MIAGYVVISTLVCAAILLMCGANYRMIAEDWAEEKAEQLAEEKYREKLAATKYRIHVYQVIVDEMPKENVRK